MKYITLNKLGISFIFLIASINAHPKTNQTSYEKAGHVSSNKTSLQFKSEGRISKNKIDKNNRGFYPFLPYAEIEFQYDKDKNTQLLLEISAEQRKHILSMGLEELRFSYAWTLIPVKLSMGYLPIPLGYREKNKYVFSREFSFYPVLETKREDIALTTQLILKKYDKHSSPVGVSLQGSVWGGWSKRSSDKTYKPPDKVPFIISLKGQGSFWSAFVSWLQKDPAFFTPLRAIGGGAYLKHSHKKLTLSFQSALWHIQEEGQSTVAYFVHPSITLYKVTAGLGLGFMNRFFPNFREADVQSALYDRAFYMAFQAHPNIRLIGERRISGQDQGPLTMDMLSFRVKIHFDF